MSEVLIIIAGFCNPLVVTAFPGFLVYNWASGRQPAKTKYL